MISENFVVPKTLCCPHRSKLVGEVGLTASKLPPLLFVRICCGNPAVFSQLTLGASTYMASDHMQFRDNIRTSTSCVSLNIKCGNQHACRLLVQVRSIAQFRCSNIFRTFHFPDNYQRKISKSFIAIRMRETCRENFMIISTLLEVYVKIC